MQCWPRVIILGVVVALFALFRSDGWATAFVIVQVQDGYVVGGDSLRVEARKKESYCKIRYSGKMVLVVWSRSNPNKPKLDLRTISQPILNDPLGTPHEKAQELWDYIYKQDHEYIDFLARVKWNAGFAFVSFYDADSRQLEVPGGDPTNPKRDYVQGVAAGAYDASQKYIDKHPTKGFRSIDGARRLIVGALAAETQAAPGFVGPPFNIVHITKSGVTTLMAGACPTVPQAH